MKALPENYTASIEAVCEALDIELVELDDWNCCGATAAHSINHKASIELPGRNLSMAEKFDRDILVPCPLCFNRLKHAEKEMLGKDAGHFDYTYTGKIKVYDLANFMARDDMLARMESKIQRRLEGLKAVCYYGCMASRPPQGYRFFRARKPHKH